MAYSKIVEFAKATKTHHAVVNEVCERCGNSRRAHDSKSTVPHSQDIAAIRNTMRINGKKLNLIECLENGGFVSHSK